MLTVYSGSCKQKLKVTVEVFVDELPHAGLAGRSARQKVVMPG